jgi:hypothetical protein
MISNQFYNNKRVYIRVMPTFIYSFFNLILCIYILFIPFVVVNIRVIDLFYHIKYPIKIGLFKCFDDVCRFYDKYIKKDTSIDNNDNLNYYQKVILNEENNINKKISNINVNDINEMLSIFSFASYIVIPIIIIIILICLYSIIRSIYNYIIFNDLGYEYQILVLVLTSILTASTAIIYMYLTNNHLDGGKYDEGIHLLIYSSLIGIILSLISILFGKLSNNTYNYTSIISNNNNNNDDNNINIKNIEISNKSSYQTIDL